MRKLHRQLETLIKKIDATVDHFDKTWDKFNRCDSGTSLHQKFNEQLQECIDDLTNFKDETKTYIASNEMKDKTLVHKKKDIEERLELYKELVRQRPKMFSVVFDDDYIDLDDEGLEMKEWLESCIQKFSKLITNHREDIENEDDESVDEDTLEEYIESHNRYILNLEKTIDMLERGVISTEDVDDIKYALDIHLTDFQYIDYHEDEELFDDILEKYESYNTKIQELNESNATPTISLSKKDENSVSTSTTNNKKGNKPFTSVVSSPSNELSINNYVANQAAKNNAKKEKKKKQKKDSKKSVNKPPTQTLSYADVTVNKAKANKDVIVPISNSDSIVPINEDEENAFNDLTFGGIDDDDGEFSMDDVYSFQIPKANPQSDTIEKATPVKDTIVPAKSPDMAILESRSFSAIAVDTQIYSSFSYRSSDIDTSKPQYYPPENLNLKWNCFPRVQHPMFHNPRFFEKLSDVSLFFNFYHLVGKAQHRLAADQLKKRGYQFNPNDSMWYIRETNPAQTSDGQETGSFKIFDPINWCFKKLDQSIQLESNQPMQQKYMQQQQQNEQMSQSQFRYQQQQQQQQQQMQPGQNSQMSYAYPNMGRQQIQ